MIAVWVTVYSLLTVLAVWYVAFKSELRDHLPLAYEDLRGGIPVRTVFSEFAAGAALCPDWCRPWWVLLLSWVLTVPVFGWTWVAVLGLTGTYGLFIAAAYVAEWAEARWWTPDAVTDIALEEELPDILDVFIEHPGDVEPNGFGD